MIQIAAVLEAGVQAVTRHPRINLILPHQSLGMTKRKKTEKKFESISFVRVFYLLAVIQTFN